MAAGSAAALICDTGALLDYLVESAPDHELFRNAIDLSRRISATCRLVVNHTEEAIAAPSRRLPVTA